MVFLVWVLKHKFLQACAVIQLIWLNYRSVWIPGTYFESINRKLRTWWLLKRHEFTNSWIGDDTRMFGSVVVVAFQITFRAEIYVNNFFYFLKIIFDISILKQSKKYKPYSILIKKNFEIQWKTSWSGEPNAYMTCLFIYIYSTIFFLGLQVLSSAIESFSQYIIIT